LIRRRRWAMARQVRLKMIGARWAKVGYGGSSVRVDKRTV
jgi:hypothetical protein